MSRTKTLAASLSILAAAFVGFQSSVAGTEASRTPNGLPQGSEAVTLNPADFTTKIDNPYWPMRPGTRWVYRETEVGGPTLRVLVTSPTRRS